VAGSAIHNYTPQTADSIKKHLPAPSPQDRAESDQDGHPARVKVREGSLRAEKGMGGRRSACRVLCWDMENSLLRNRGRKGTLRRVRALHKSAV